MRALGLDLSFCAFDANGTCLGVEVQRAYLTADALKLKLGALRLTGSTHDQVETEFYTLDNWTFRVVYFKNSTSIQKVEV